MLRAAVIATVVTVPIIVIALISLNSVLRLPVTTAGWSLPVSRLEALPVDLPPDTPEAAANCPGLIVLMPLEVADQPSRPVSAPTPYAYAWGADPIVLRCGVPRPDGYVTGADLLQVNAVTWFCAAEDSADPTALCTTVDRPVFVDVRVPAALGTPAGVLAELSPLISQALQLTEQPPG